MAQYGAYSPEKTYSAEDVGHLVNYARVRGVKVIPEFDAPAHVGNGWQFAEKNHPEWGKLAVCVNQEEWQDFCVEPPCGQVSPFFLFTLAHFTHFLFILLQSKYLMVIDRVAYYVI